MSHRHDWILFRAFAEGYFSKRGDKTDAVWFLGSVKKCRGRWCEVLLFVPFNENLIPVECEREKSDVVQVG